MESGVKRAIVITSIFQPTEAVRKFAALDGYKLFVVGDKKTPEKWHCENVTFISYEDQLASGWGIATQLPVNHYCRKMIGYLEAMKWGAEQIVDTDDDNIPYQDWSFPSTTCDLDTLKPGLGFVNIYQLFTGQHIWPRGLPLQFINNKRKLEDCVLKSHAKIGVWQGLADEDPDVDAVYRLTNDVPCIFEKRDPVVLEKGTIAPFNSQNTSFIKELFPLLYLPSTVTFRYTDILRGLLAQPLMWKLGYRLGFTGASVVQKRNPHNYLHDFESEYPMYQTGHKVPELINKYISNNIDVGEMLQQSYECLFENGVVEKGEITTLSMWLVDVQKAMGANHNRLHTINHSL
jgi:hypothetical protein